MVKKEIADFPDPRVTEVFQVGFNYSQNNKILCHSVERVNCLNVRLYTVDPAILQRFSFEVYFELS